ncbi:MAG: exostosin family protein [Candidatus Peribacteraceae bacterium]|nr:exostosin family protein [Candidatus Peribacteraceae bacterium]
MISVFARHLPDVPHIPLLYPNLGRQERESILFLNNAFRRLTDPIVRTVDRPEDADFLLVPHNYSSIRRETGYFSDMVRLAERTGKKILVFWHGDGDGPVPYPHTVIVRTSQYRYRMRPNEIMMPAYAEDLLGDASLQVRSKGEGTPVVGFCGWVTYKNAKNAVGTTVKNALVDVRKAFVRNPALEAEKKGITLRRKALAVLESSARVRCNVIRRRSYSGHASTIGLDPAQARREYVDNMLRSDLSLVVKGDGNYSYRFYEALSLGRVPLFLDTACCLPLADVIDYGSFLLTVDVADLSRLADIAAERFAALSDEEFQAMQKSARAAFDRYLRVDRYLPYLCDRVLPRYT